MTRKPPTRPRLPASGGSWRVEGDDLVRAEEAQPKPKADSKAKPVKEA